MATTIRVQASHASVSGIPADACVNVWHFRGLATDPIDAAVASVNALETFYEGVQDLFCANTMSGVITYKAYDLLDAEPRVPIHTRTSEPIDPTAGDGLPTECAITVSFGGSAESGLPQRRRTGRVYIGALSTGVTTTVTGFVQVASTARAIIQSAAHSLIADVDPLVTIWSVFSPTTAGATPWDASALFNATTYVTEGYIDNALDTQRRRGTLPSDRTVFGA